MKNVPNTLTVAGEEIILSLTVGSFRIAELLHDVSFDFNALDSGTLLQEQGLMLDLAWIACLSERPEWDRKDFILFAAKNQAEQ